MNLNFGFFDADTLKRAAQAVGLGVGASAFSPEEAEAFPAVKDFASSYGAAVRAKKGGHMLAGSLDNEEAFVGAAKRDSSIKNNNVEISIHAGRERWIKDGVEPEETGRMVEEILNSNSSRAMPNFPTSNPALARSKGMIQVKDSVTGKDIVAPVIGNESGNVVFKTTMNPVGSKQAWLDRYLGRPTSPMSGLRGNPASAQPPGLSAVEERSSDVTIPESVNGNNKFIPAVPLAAGLGAGLAMPEDAQAAGQGIPQPSGEPSLLAGLARQFGLGTRGVLEGLGSGLTLGLGDPGRGLSDLLGLPLPQNETEQGRVGLNRGLSDVAGSFLLGSGLAKAPGGVVSTIGRGLSSDPVADAMLTLGDENFAAMLEHGNHIMDLLEQYEGEFGGDDSF